MERLTIAITTARRDVDTVGQRGKRPEGPVNYLDDLINMLIDQGAKNDDILLFRTAPDAPDMPHWSGWIAREEEGTDFRFHPIKGGDGIVAVFDPDAPLCLVENSDRMIEHAIRWAERRGRTRFLQVQDDIVLCRNALRRIKQIKSPPNAGIISFYTPWEAGDRHRRRVETYPCGSVYGSLINLWNIEAAKEFLRCTEPRVQDKRDKAPGSGTGPTGIKGWDLMIKWWLQWSDRFRSYRHVPCLAQHIGRVSSSAKAVGQRTTQNFLGVEYDATSER